MFLEESYVISKARVPPPLPSPPFPSIFFDYFQNGNTLAVNMILFLLRFFQIYILTF